MGQQELSPHEETILFQLVEIERSLPGEEQSRRFKVTISRRPSQAPEPSVQPATASRVFKLNTDANCFLELAAAGYMDGGRIRASYLKGIVSVHDLRTVQLLEFAFDYYHEKHGFPTNLADERREFIGATISTVYPEVVAHLKKPYDWIWVDQPEGNWASVAHDCQEAPKSFAGAVSQADYASKLGEQSPSSSDVDKKL